jgi:hypothetical protein
MKTLFISTTLILTLASFGSAAYANVDKSHTTETCSSIPIARPTGGATRERLQAIKRCNEIQARKQQTPSTSATEQSNPPTQISLPTQ